MSRRGPDGSGEWRYENVVFGHQRLAVRDTSVAGEQPMSTPDGRYHIVYNGELYNDAELRRELTADSRHPHVFKGTCDTETVLLAFAMWGRQAFARLRGMYAIAVYDTREHVLHLARDPMGIKPLYYHLGSNELTFASEPRAILAHPTISARPNMGMVSAYLSTVRSVLGSHTMFDGMHALRPGERAEFDSKTGRFKTYSFHKAAAVEQSAWDMESAAEAVRTAMQDSVERHLQADVPICSLLSGGLDSSIIGHILAGQAGGSAHASRRTWCAGSVDSHGEHSADFSYARMMAERMGAEHHEVIVERGQFAEQWPWMIGELGVPLSTPNEVAIHAVCRDLRAQGCVVALSGEGADELFAGYDYAMQAAADYCASTQDTRSGGRYQLESSAWVPPALKPRFIEESTWKRIEGDALLFNHYEELFERCTTEAGQDAAPTDAHLRFLRHNNLTGLLQRLDTASMLASVEGRTPFADMRILDLAERLPMSVKMTEYETGGSERVATMATAVRGKMVLRHAWRDQLPAAICNRAKESFPLPFQAWLADQTPILRESPFVQTFFDKELCDEIAGQPENYFQFAWPLLNLAIWGEHWWG